MVFTKHLLVLQYLTTQIFEEMVDYLFQFHQYYISNQNLEDKSIYKFSCWCYVRTAGGSVGHQFFIPALIEYSIHTSKILILITLLFLLLLIL